MGAPKEVTGLGKSIKSELPPEQFIMIWFMNSLSFCILRPYFQTYMTWKHIKTIQFLTVGLPQLPKITKFLCSGASCTLPASIRPFSHHTQGMAMFQRTSNKINWFAQCHRARPHSAWGRTQVFPGIWEYKRTPRAMLPFQSC